MMIPNGRGLYVLKVNFVGGGPTEVGQRESVRPWSREVNPVVFDKFGIGGDMEDEDEIDEGLGEDPERLKLREDGDVVQKTEDPKLPSEEE
eukprot:12301151-Karenia_brevis.AAC.1